MSILNPYILIGILLSMLGSYMIGHHFGWEQRDQEMQIAIAEANEKARKVEQDMTQQVSDKSDELRRTKNALTKKQADMAALAAGGGLRLPTSCDAAMPASPAASSGDSRKAESDVERQTVEALVSIAADGDKAIAQLNACIDSYNAVREQLNGKR